MGPKVILPDERTDGRTDGRTTGLRELDVVHIWEGEFGNIAEREQTKDQNVFFFVYRDLKCNKYLVPRQTNTVMVIDLLLENKWFTKARLAVENERV